MNATNPAETNDDLRSRTANVGGIRLHYLLGGDPNGMPVLLWHGFLGTCQVWRKVIPALLWAADHPEEVLGLLYIEGPVMLSTVLTKMISYTPEAMSKGSMWWWILPLAPGVPERLVVGREREFLTWFYDTATAKRDAITEADVNEVLRTFAGREGVLGAMGVYRAAFTSIEQTEPLTRKLLGEEVNVPVVALGGEKGLGAKVKQMVELVAQHVEGGVVPDCGHFLPEECPDEVVKHILSFTKKNQETIP